MRLAVEHRTTYRYEPPAHGLALRLRLYAVNTAQQQVLDWQVRVNGEPVRPLFTTAFGEPEALWFQARTEETVEIEAAGRVLTSDAAGVLGREIRVRPGIYLRDTALTEADEAVEALVESLAPAEDGPLPRLHALSTAIHETLDYRAGVTDATTTAPQVVALGAGVCQDYAHLFIAAARAMEVPARYVVGYLHDAEAPPGETHAWAEAHVEGLGWIGFDPVHNVCPALTHVRLASGFDAADAAPIRGTLHPGVEESLTVSVSVTGPDAGGQPPAGSQAQSQTRS
ncbi:MAG: transglutaminase family protein [Pseudomonadota bacterium]